MPVADINGTTLFYEIDGAGPPCLVLHGLGVDHSYLKSLGPLAARRQLVLYDHRGCGRSGRPSLDTLAMEQVADDAAALADHLGFDRFDVLGHSYGGFVAQELAIRHPDRVAALILVATTPGQLGTDEQPDEQEQGPATPPEVEAALSSAPATDEEYGATHIALLRHYLHKRDPATVEPLFADTVYSASAMVRCLQVLGGWSSIDRLGLITAPTLLVVGRHDVFTSFPQSYRIGRRIPDAEVVVMEDVGHFPWLEDPGTFFSLVGDWLDRKGGR
jgi:proline iminopeptidase